MARLRDLAPPLLPVAAAAALFAESFRADRAFLPHHTRELEPWSARVGPEEREALRERSVYGLSDKLWMFHPPVVEAGRALLAGESPAWNRSAMGGFPQLDGTITGLLYPLHLPLLFGDTLRLYGPLAALHCALAALFLHAFLRRLSFSSSAAAFGGLVFGLGGWQALRAHYFMVAAAGTWLPLALLSIESLAQNRSRGWIFAGASAIALSALAGYPQIALLVVETSVAYAIWRAIRLRGETRSAARPRDAFGPRRFLGRGALLFALAACLAAPQTLPTARFAARAAREKASPRELRDQGISLGHLVGFVAPEAIGDPVRWKDPEPPGTRPPLSAHLLVSPTAVAFNVFETTAYAGILPLLLAGYALLRRRDPTVLFSAAVGLVGLALSFGSPPLCLLAYLLPGFRYGAPARNLFLVAFALPVLAAAGLEALRKRRETTGSAPARWCLAGFLVAASFAAFLSFGESAAAGRRLLAPLLAMRASALAGRPVSEVEVVERVPPSEFHSNVELLRGASYRLALLLGASAAAVAFLRGRALAAAALAIAAGDLLVYAAPLTRPVPREGLFERPLLLDGVPDEGGPWRFFRVGDPTFLAPQTLSLYGLEDAGGYTHSLDDYERFVGRIDPAATTRGVGAQAFSVPEALEKPAARLLNARWLFAPAGLSLPGCEEVARDDDAGYALWRDPRALPRAFFVSRAIAARDREEALDRVHDPAFSPQSEVVLLGDGGTTRDPGGTGVARLLRARSDEVECEVEATTAGWLVLLETWDPGWSATVNGEEAAIFRGDFLFRAVAVPEGRSTVRFRYASTPLRVGLAIAAAGVAATALALALARRRERAA